MQLGSGVLIVNSEECKYIAHGPVSLRVQVDDKSAYTMPISQDETHVAVNTAERVVATDLLWDLLSPLLGKNGSPASFPALVAPIDDDMDYYLAFACGIKRKWIAAAVYPACVLKLGCESYGCPEALLKDVRTKSAFSFPRSAMPLWVSRTGEVIGTLQRFTWEMYRKRCFSTPKVGSPLSRGQEKGRLTCINRYNLYTNEPIVFEYAAMNTLSEGQQVSIGIADSRIPYQVHNTASKIRNGKATVEVTLSYRPRPGCKEPDAGVHRVVFTASSPREPPAKLECVVVCLQYRSIFDEAARPSRVHNALTFDMVIGESEGTGAVAQFLIEGKIHTFYHTRGINRNGDVIGAWVLDSIERMARDPDYTAVRYYRKRNNGHSPAFRSKRTPSF